MKKILDAMEPVNRHSDLVARNGINTSREQATLISLVEVLQETNLNLQNSMNSRMDDLESKIAGAPFLGDFKQPQNLVELASNNTLARIIRTELKQLVIPVVEARSSSYQSASEAQIVAIREIIDSMANDFHQSMQGVSRHDEKKTFQVSGRNEHNVETDQECLRNSAADSFSVDQNFDACRANKDSTTLLKSHVRLWIRTWTFKWRVGTLYVTVSVFKIDRDYQTTRNAYQTSNIHEPRMAYRLQLDFIPGQNFLALKGTSISCRSQRDQRGYLEICPMISSFAVIPCHSDIFSLSRNGDIEGLRLLFRNRAGSPTDRDERGRTPLHVRTLYMNL